MTITLVVAIFGSRAMIKEKLNPEAPIAHPGGAEELRVLSMELCSCFVIGVHG